MQSKSKTPIQVAAALMLGAGAAAFAQGGGLNLIVNGTVASHEVRVIGGRPFVPLADVAKALNMTVSKKPGGYEIAAAGGAGQVGDGHTGKIGAEIFTGQFRFQVVNVRTVSSYTQHYDQDGADIAPSGAGDTMVVVDCRVKNGTKQKQELVYTPSDYGENTALTDSQEHSYQPYKYDAHHDEGAPNGAYILPGAAQDFAIVFSVPKGTSPKDLVFTLVKYGERGDKKGVDVRVSLAP